jgi:hypothetical protein
MSKPIEGGCLCGAVRSTRRYCSDACKQAAYRERMHDSAKPQGKAIGGLAALAEAINGRPSSARG